MKSIIDRFRPDRSGRKKQVSSVVVIILNIVLLASAAFLYGHYSNMYSERLRQENLGNISNLNQSAAASATALISSWNTKLDDVVQYIDRQGLTHDQALAMIDDANSSPDRQFQLIGSDYTGYLARRGEDGGYIPLSYELSSYTELQKAFDNVQDDNRDGICFAPEFTDSNTALKYFAIYRHLAIPNEAGEKETYTLMLATKSSDVLAAFNNQNDFKGQSTVLVDSIGNYIVSNSEFKSTNFYQYLYVYNDLALDERNEIERQVESSGSGELYYVNSIGQNCVFRYSKLPTSNWYCITSVPIASFRSPAFSINYAVYAVLVLLALMVIDLVWLRQMNKRLRLSMLREKDASEAKTDFLSRMSHDIRTPLNGIIGLTSLAIDEASSPEMLEYLDKIQLSGQFLMGLVNDILDLSKVESGKVELQPEPYVSRDLCKYAEAVIAPLCTDKGLEFNVTPPDNEPPVLLDRLRFNQVMFNLLSNAVKYTPAGGMVELRWQRTELDGGRVALDFTVRDNGIGMSEEFQKRMFDSFSQEHSQTATTGSGLGLAIVRSLVGLMNGQISVESTQGRGTAITIHLETDVCTTAVQQNETAEGSEISGKRVLICEDNEINIFFIQRLLEKWNVITDAAENGSIGLEKFRISPEDWYDAVLMDVMMPEMNGLDATRAIRSLDRNDASTVPIIAMTANAYDTDVKNCLDAGMNAHVGKPIDQQLLRSTLERLLR